jgi:hypothetical protein
MADRLGTPGSVGFTIIVYSYFFLEREREREREREGERERVRKYFLEQKIIFFWPPRFLLSPSGSYYHTQLSFFLRTFSGYLSGYLALAMVIWQQRTPLVPADGRCLALSPHGMCGVL